MAIERLLTHLASSASTMTTGYLALAFVVILAFKMYKKYSSLPPGPWGYPILGVIPYLKKEFHLFLDDYAKQFGKIYTFRMGQQQMLVLSDHKMIKKVFQNKEFASRPRSELQSILQGYGIINSAGQLWKDQRRFLLKQQMGMRQSNAHQMLVNGGLRSASGIKHMESRIFFEAVDLIHTLAHEYDSKPVDPAPLVQCAAANVVATMIFSARFVHDDARFRRFMFLFDEGFRLCVDTGLMNFIPMLGYHPANVETCKKLKANRDEMVEFVREVIRDHEETLDVDSPRDLVDAYLIKHKELKAEDSLNEHYHGYDATRQLEQIILDLFSAGVETVSNTMLWTLVYMMHHPDVMAKAKAEISGVVGGRKLPELDDMKRLPYTRAVICEVMRKSSIVPIGVSHATVGTSKIEGYTVPDNTHIVPLIHAVHHDPSEWSEPERFNPSRFLSENGSEVVKPEAFMPFSIGQRQCMGDHLAERELFLFFSILLHTFNISPAPSKSEKSSLPSLKGVSGATVRPQNFELKFTQCNVEALAFGMAKASERKENSQHIRVYG